MDTSSTKKLVSDLIDQEKDTTLAWLQNFLHHPSVVGQEESSQRYYADLLKELGLEVDLWYPKPEDMDCNPYFLPYRNDYSNSPDVVGHYKGTGGGRSMMLSGHVDVVPEGDNDWWDDPWSGLRKEGRIYGRGASDMKGGIICNTIALHAIMKAGIKLKGDVYLGSVIGEETGGAGTLSMISRGYTADGAIVPEPSDLHICPVSMGVSWFKVTVRGLAAHAANAHLGVNAISKAMLIVNALDECNEKERQTLKHKLYYEVPNPFNINMGEIRGGKIATSVPDEVVIEGRIAFSPDEDVSVARKVLEDAVCRAADADPWLKDHQPEVEWYGFCLNSGSIPEDHPLMQTMTANYTGVTGDEPMVSGTPWGTDAGAMIRYGNMPTVVFGPGPRHTAHQANEYVDENKMLSVAKVIAATLLDWCGYEDAEA